MENNFYRQIREEIPGVQLTPEAAWSGITTLGAGIAPVPVAVVSTRQDLCRLCTIARSAGFCLFPLGAGSNLAGSDHAMEKVLFVKLSKTGEFAELAGLNGTGLFRAGCANSMSQILNFALKESFGGASGLIGIPGSLGGLLKMNAGARGMSISDFLEEMEILELETGSISTVPKDHFQWRYRDSGIPDNCIVLSATFHFKAIDIPAEEELLRAEQLRRSKAPKGRSAGSVFRNPASDLPAGLLLEQCGAKGMSEGAYHVSPEHANWIVSAPDCREERREQDIRKLIHRMQQCVFDKTSIILKPEIRFANMTNQDKVFQTEKKLKVLVLKGGVSSEREISLLSAANVANALRAAGHDVTEYDIQKLEITDDMRKADVVFPVLHGGFGEDGRIQKLMEDAGITFVGGSSEACRIVMDKTASKKIMDNVGVRNAKYAVMKAGDVNTGIPAGMELPLIVKPNSEGSTFGLTLVETMDQWQDALKLAFSYDKTILVEEYINGIEATVGILLGKALPMTEIRYPGKLYDYDAKYTHAQGETLYLCPPQGVSEAAQKEAAALAERFADAVKSTDLLRVDVLIRRSDDKVFVLEGNSLPGFTASSLLPKAAAAAGMSNPEVCSKLVVEAYSRKK